MSSSDLQSELDLFRNIDMSNPDLFELVMAHFERILHDRMRAFMIANPRFSNSISEVELKTEKYNEEKCTCSLCLDEIEKGSDVYRLTCNHVFHSHNCVADKNIINWLKKDKTCPYCRTYQSYQFPETFHSPKLPVRSAIDRHCLFLTLFNDEYRLDDDDVVEILCHHPQISMEAAIEAKNAVNERYP
jgi:hypothetical protein